MGVARQTAAAGTGRFVGKLEADREEKGQDKLDKRLAIADQLEVGGWVLEVDSEGSVLASRLGGLAGSGKFHIPPNLVVECVPTHRKPPEVRICRLSIQSAVGTRPPATSTPHWPARWARR